MTAFAEFEVTTGKWGTDALGFVHVVASQRFGIVLIALREFLDTTGGQLRSIRSYVEVGPSERMKASFHREVQRRNIFPFS
ncbi:hypothetical protein [Caballeronia concitans]|uniref:hypothetical protein n=1 Tax=Caballeronia concitans TaxID=1777133 RepID=UPI000B357214|nr:hypothetical protein [Caballeronia concitans]